MFTFIEANLDQFVEQSNGDLKKSGNMSKDIMAQLPRLEPSVSMRKRLRIRERTPIKFCAP